MNICVNIFFFSFCFLSLSIYCACKGFIMLNIKVEWHGRKKTHFYWARRVEESKINVMCTVKLVTWITGPAGWMLLLLLFFALIYLFLLLLQVEVYFLFFPSWISFCHRNKLFLSLFCCFLSFFFCFLSLFSVIIIITNSVNVMC